MTADKKAVQSDMGPIHDTGLIYSRVMGLMSCRDFDLQSLFMYELSPLPTSLFNDKGDMRPAHSKSVLKNVLQECVSDCVIKNTEMVIIDR